MLKKMMVLTVLGAIYSASPVPAEEEHPKKAVCQVCSQKGEGHGVEKVAAWSAYQGNTYYFCSEHCREEFDADPAGFLPQVFPRPAEAVNAVDMDGVSVRLSEYEGKVLLLDFWATWCKPCVKIMPRLDALHREHAENGLEVLGISIDEDPETVKDFLEKKNVDYRIAVDDAENPTWSGWSVKAVPTTFLIDRDGNIVARWVGEPDEDALRASVEASLAGKKEPALD